MSALESVVILIPRFTTLVGGGALATPPLDVSRYGGAQLQIWWAESIGASAPVKVYLEESLDGVEWPLDASMSYELPGTYKSQFFSIGFRLRWFRLRVEPNCEFVTLWAEGILRAGGGGSQAWLQPAAPVSLAGPGLNIGEDTPEAEWRKWMEKGGGKMSHLLDKKGGGGGLLGG